MGVQCKAEKVDGRDLQEGYHWEKNLARAQVIEFPKEVLPNGNLLFILEQESQPKEEEEYGSMVCSKFQEKEAQPELYGAVTWNITHRLCRALIPNSPWMKGHSECRIHYPPPFSENTTYPIYLCRNQPDHCAEVHGWDEWWETDGWFHISPIC